MRSIETHFLSYKPFLVDGTSPFLSDDATGKIFRRMCGDSGEVRT